MIYTFVRTESTFSEDSFCYAQLNINQSHRNLLFFLAEQEFKHFLFEDCVGVVFL